MKQPIRILIKHKFSQTNTHSGKPVMSQRLPYTYTHILKTHLHLHIALFRASPMWKNKEIYSSKIQWQGSRWRFKFSFLFFSFLSKNYRNFNQTQNFTVVKQSVSVSQILQHYLQIKNIFTVHAIITGGTKMKNSSPYKCSVFFVCVRMVWKCCCHHVQSAVSLVARGHQSSWGKDV